MTCEIEELIFRALQDLAIAHIVQGGKSCFSIEDYREAWATMASSRTISNSLRPSDDLVARQIDSCGYVRQLVPGLWAIYPAAVERLKKVDLKSG